MLAGGMRPHSHHLFAALLAVLGVVSACKQERSGPTLPASATAKASAASEASSAAQPKAPTRPENPAEKALSTWNSALDRRDEAKLAKLYAPHVRFYGVRKSLAEVLGAKHQAFERQPNFRQRVGDVRIERTKKGFVVRFVKQSGADFSSVADARLRLEAATGGQLLITEETDATTDKRFGKKNPPSDCYSTVSSGVAALSEIETDNHHVTRENPDVAAGGVLFSEEPGKLEAAQGYFHPERFEPRWWIDVVNGELTVRDALTDQQLAIPGSLRKSTREACAPPEEDGGAKNK